MDYVRRVNVAHGGTNLPHNVPRLIFFHLVIRIRYLVIQTSPMTAFSDYIDKSRIFEYLIKSHDIWMIKTNQCLEFPFYPLKPCSIAYLWNTFNSVVSCVITLDLRRLLDCPEATLTQYEGKFIYFVYRP